MDKNLHFTLFFSHFYPFLFIPFFDLHSSPFLFIPLFLVWDPKTNQNEHFCAIFSTKSLPFRIPNLGSKSWFIRECSKCAVFKWTVVSTIPLHSSTDQSKGPLSIFVDLTYLIPIERFLLRKSGTLRWHMDKNLHFTVFFSHFYPFLFIPFFDLHSSPFLFIPLFLVWDPKLAKMNTFKCNLLHKKRSIPNS